MVRSLRSDGFVRPGAEVKDRTAGAIRPLGLAEGPTVEDEEVGDEGPLLSGDDSAELLLNLALLLTVRQAQPIGYARDVGVHRDPFGDAEGVAKDDVGRLAPDA